MTQVESIQIFEAQKVHTVWDEGNCPKKIGHMMKALL